MRQGAAAPCAGKSIRDAQLSGRVRLLLGFDGKTTLNTLLWLLLILVFALGGYFLGRRRGNASPPVSASDVTLEHLQLSSEIARQISTVLRLEALLPHIVEAIQGRFGCYFVGVWLRTPEGDALTLEAAGCPPGMQLPPKGARLPLEPDSPWGRACLQGACLPINNLPPDFPHLPQVRPGRSALLAPLQVGDGVKGVLEIQHDRPHAFSPVEVTLLQGLADQVAVAIRNARLYEAEQSRRQLAESLQKIGSELAGSLDMRQVPQQILEQLAAVVPYERGSVMLQREDELEIIAQRGFPDDQRAINLRIAIREGDVFQQMVQANKPIWVDDVTQTSGWQQLDWLPLNRSWMGVPLITKNRVIGMISLTRKEAAAFTEEDAALVLTFAGQAAIALENASLYDEITRFNAELEKAYHNLARLDQAKADFIEVAAHELRTPLTVIKGYTQVLATRPGIVNDTDSQVLLQSVMDGVNRLHEIINSMLDVSKIDNQTLSMHIEPTWLHMVLRRVAGELKEALLERNITLTITGLQELPWIQADSELLYKVFYHLVINAIKYTPDGGRITVSGRKVLGNGNVPSVEVQVQDTGIGIDPAHHELVFEKFYQTGKVSVHSSGRTKFKGGGPGLGLAIARGIVEAHGGRIWVESPGHDEENFPGSTFFVQLPIKAVNARYAMSETSVTA